MTGLFAYLHYAYSSMRHSWQKPRYSIISGHLACFPPNTADHRHRLVSAFNINASTTNYAALWSFHLGLSLKVQTWLRLQGMLTMASVITPTYIHVRPLQRWCHSLNILVYTGWSNSVTHKYLVHLCWWRDSAFLLQGVHLGSVPKWREALTTGASP